MKKRSSRKKKKIRSLGMMHDNILKAINSATRKGKDWRTDRRFLLLKKAEKKLRQRVHDAYAERG
jgi:hypothetical protein